MDAEHTMNSDKAHSKEIPALAMITSVSGFFSKTKPMGSLMMRSKVIG
jgi:hypothetical protein